MNLNICNNCGGEFTYRGGKYICLACGSPKPEAITSEEVTLLYTLITPLAPMPYCLRILPRQSWSLTISSANIRKIRMRIGDA